VCGGNVGGLIDRYPCYENPYPMDMHDSPVTSCLYFADCPPDLIPAYYSVGSKSKSKTGYSEKVLVHLIQFTIKLQFYGRRT